MFKRINAQKHKDKQRYRIFASSTDHYLADIWAVDENDALTKAAKLKPWNFRDMAGTFEIEKVRKIESRDLQFEPFRPLN